MSHSFLPATFLPAIFYFRKGSEFGLIRNPNSLSCKQIEIRTPMLLVAIVVGW